MEGTVGRGHWPAPPPRLHVPPPPPPPPSPLSWPLSSLQESRPGRPSSICVLSPRSAVPTCLLSEMGPRA